jgi:hypothetical protein
MDFNPAMMMQGCGPMQGNNQMQQMFQFMQIMQLMQMMQQFGGGQQGMGQCGGGQDPFGMSGVGPQNFMNQTQPMPWNQCGCRQNQNISPAYINSARQGPQAAPFPLDQNASSADQLSQVKGWSRDNFARNGVSPYTSLQQDVSTNKVFTQMQEKSSAELLGNLKSHPQEKPVHKEIWESVNARATALRERGEEVSESQVMMWNAQELRKAAGEGRVSADTGQFANNYLKVANAGNQAQVDTMIKGGQPIPQELQRYAQRSQFNH